MLDLQQLTEDARGKLFMEGYKELERLYGVTLQFKLEPESYGSMVQVKLVHGLALIEDWIPPSPHENNDE